jgi:hypothetical protein
LVGDTATRISTIVTVWLDRYTYSWTLMKSMPMISAESQI